MTEEYRKLPAWDEQWGGNGVFLCHHSATRDQKAICRGWAEVQNHNISVRLTLSRIRPDNFAEPTKVPLYSSGAEACRAGLRGVRRPSVKAKKVCESLVKARAIASRRASQ